ncbi:hypothetical protein RSAG8_00257, partial [Rhizoctonia solani AG-8 WAC10335]
MFCPYCSMFRITFVTILVPSSISSAFITPVWRLSVMTPVCLFWRTLIRFRQGHFDRGFSFSPPPSFTFPKAAASYDNLFPTRLLLSN